MVIFHCYVSSPEGKMGFSAGFSADGNSGIQPALAVTGTFIRYLDKNHA